MEESRQSLGQLLLTEVTCPWRIGISQRKFGRNSMLADGGVVGAISEGCVTPDLRPVDRVIIGLCAGFMG